MGNGIGSNWKATIDDLPQVNEASGRESDTSRSLRGESNEH